MRVSLAQVAVFAVILGLVLALGKAYYERLGVTKELVELAAELRRDVTILQIKVAALENESQRAHERISFHHGMMNVYYAKNPKEMREQVWQFAMHIARLYEWDWAYRIAFHLWLRERYD